MEDTIGAIQCRISEKYDQKRESLASMHAANQEWLQSAVNEHVKNFNPQGPQITVVGAPAKKAKISESAQKEAEKENAGKQRGELQHPSPNDPERLCLVTPRTTQATLGTNCPDPPSQPRVASVVGSLSKSHMRTAYHRR